MPAHLSPFISPRTVGHDIPPSVIALSRWQRAPKSEKREEERQSSSNGVLSSIFSPTFSLFVIRCYQAFFLFSVDICDPSPFLFSVFSLPLPSAFPLPPRHRVESGEFKAASVSFFAPRYSVKKVLVGVLALIILHVDLAVSQSHLFRSKPYEPSREESNIFEASTAGNVPQMVPTVTPENVFNWTKNDKRRLLHVVYRVGDLDKTIKFYTECLGMKLLRKRDIPEERYTNAFLGYGPEDSHFSVELTYNYGVDKYDIGTGFGHFGIAVDDVVKMVDLIKAKGGKVTREPGPVKGGSSIIACIEDPDGYTFELLERGPTPEPLCQVMLRVGDLDRSINLYKKAFGMELLRKRDNPDYKYTIATMGYGPEDKNAVVELTYNYGVTEYDKGNGYAQIAIGTDDVYKTAEAVKFCGGNIAREAGPLPGINTKITVCLDPDGWKMVFVDNADFLKELE